FQISVLLEAEAMEHALQELGVGQFVVVVGLLGERVADAAGQQQRGGERRRDHMTPKVPERGLGLTQIVPGRSPFRHRDWTEHARARIPGPTRDHAPAALRLASPMGIYITDQGAFAASLATRESYSSPITPATMPTSARLNTYHRKVQEAVVMWNSTKS